MKQLRELTFELSQLSPPRREQLLRELPEEQRMRIIELLSELERELQGSDSKHDSFETHLAATEDESRSLALLNQGQLRLLVAAEHPAVQERIVSSLRRPAHAMFAPAVAKLVSEHLVQKLEVNRIRGEKRPARGGLWRRILRGVQ